ncbi:hypothetical protein C2845_PM01G43490 [Panicum miliaceum]|uniref:Uncharacterized protein n=1 Tax=Panicum miliaceum TaxID=4540 RepID=A0A3L6TKK8_PANMI|nr:hypothetical protein C2845_PM01G43490 [Panicum miliaceum]
MAKKIKLSPVMSMLAHWQKMIADRSPIDITTLVVRIATHVKALDYAQMQKKEPARHSVAGTKTRRQTRSSTQQQEQAGPFDHDGTSHMNFVETYEYFTQGGWSVKLSTVRVRKPIMRGITDLTTRVHTMGQQQDQLNIDLAHNTELTQQNRSLNTSLLHDTTSIFTHLGLGQHLHPPQQPQQPQHPPKQH